MFKRKPVSPPYKPQDELDIIDKKVWDTLTYVKLVLIALFVYLFICTISEGFYLLRDAAQGTYGYKITKPEGGKKKLWQSPKIKIRDASAEVKNSGFKNQTSIMKSFALNANVIEGL